MKFTLKWLKKFINTDYTANDIATALTDIGFEVEELIDRSKMLKDFVIAQIIETKPHPNADRLKICIVDNGINKLQIVCGAQNAKVGLKTVLAPIGAVIPQSQLKIKESEIRGVKSFGMLCSHMELGTDELGTDDSDPSGIIDLTDTAVIGELFATYLGFDDPVFKINVTPNRSDALGVYGIARDLAAKGLGQIIEIQDFNITNDFESNVQINISDTFVNRPLRTQCPVFAIREIKNLNNKLPTPLWLKNALNNVGIKSVSIAVDIANYVSHSLGHPLHVYDADQTGDDIYITTLNAHKKPFTALNGKTYELIDEDLVIQNHESKIHCLAGIIGGQDSACSLESTRVFIESACFDAQSITNTGRRLNIETDSRYKFERSITSAMLTIALDMATYMMRSIIGCSVSNMIIKCNLQDNPIAHKRYLNFNLDLIHKVTGITIEKEIVKNILFKLGILIQKDDNTLLVLEIPQWRCDITIAEDIIEEVIRIYGYDKIHPIPLFLETKNDSGFFTINKLVASYGYIELVTWSFIHTQDAKLFCNQINANLELINPISSHMNYMRPSLLPNLLHAISKNQARSFGDLSFFELGPVFNGVKYEDEISVLSGVKCGYNVPKNCHEKQRALNAFDIKADVAKVLDFFDLAIDTLQYETNTLDFYHPTRSVILKMGDDIICTFGQLHPNIPKHFNIDGDVYAFELYLDKIPQKSRKKSDFKYSNFQSTIRDFAFIIDENQRIGDIIKAIENIDKDQHLIKKVELFDIYQTTTPDSTEPIIPNPRLNQTNGFESKGAGSYMEYVRKAESRKIRLDHLKMGLGINQKSVAFSVTIQSDEHNLQEQDLSNISMRIIETVETQFNAQLRTDRTSQIK